MPFQYHGEATSGEVLEDAEVPIRRRKRGKKRRAREGQT